MTVPRLYPFPWTVRVGSLESPVSRDGARRLLNVVIAFLGLVVAFVPMLVIALLIKLTSRGPVLFAQGRVGLDRRAPGNEGGNWRRHADDGGLTFTMYKFRTMHVDNEQPEEREVWAKPDDPRVTSVGRVLRKLRLGALAYPRNAMRQLVPPVLAQHA